MSNQVRELATRSINAYVDFFKQFKWEDGNYPTPTEVMARKYTASAAFENTFMKIKLELDFNAKIIKFDNEVMEIF